MKVLKRHDLLRPSCLGGLLGTSRRFREESIKWVEASKVSRLEWEKGKEVKCGKEQREGLVSEGSWKAPWRGKDVRRWLGHVYYLSRRLNEERERIGILD